VLGELAVKLLVEFPEHKAEPVLILHLPVGGRHAPVLLLKLVAGQIREMVVGVCGALAVFPVAEELKPEAATILRPAAEELIVRDPEARLATHRLAHHLLQHPHLLLAK
jgi:hypothetical protein